ncbi:MAG TPA: methyltransferase [Candidatus Polarisedimenticolia bacterium]
MAIRPTDSLEPWYAALEARQMRDLKFQEVRRGLQALSSLYVERRSRLASGGALDGAGKRAAFALFYGPMHFAVTRDIVRALRATRPAPKEIVDLGCGTGAAGAAFALESDPPPEITGIDRNSWAVDETSWTLRHFGLRGQAARGDLDRQRLPGPRAAVLAAFTVNELEPSAQARLLTRLFEAAGRGASLLVIEPIARRAFPWWIGWAEAFKAAGGREDSWKFPAALPERWRLLDRAAGLDHRELVARSLWLAKEDHSKKQRG